ncbi:hypothetical protein IscW_ISCW007003 [Ixodes scapularis]|uniref:RNA helicase n=1 Tax=Ixodes scapularis TaxID=6945 RepID=B7PT23_IXOSC|nr:hypothetical protein IscW_ISCW007003 [Ixodes scapularis]|eukprot:XP_002403650.1 hypothetical protein IscW_ISCW007003 [Ixodes scapularis]
MKSALDLGIATRCRDLQSFSDVPSDLEPYTQFEAEIDFKTVFVRQVLQEYSEALCKRASRCLLNQVVVCTSRWTEGMDSLLRLLRAQHSPVVLFSSFAEAAVYARVPTFVRYVDPKARDAALLVVCAMFQPLVLVLSSTWKGAQRIYDQFKLLTQDSKIPKCGVLYAGGSEAGKEVQLVNGVDVLIATPLCLLRVMHKYDHLVVNLKRCCHLVLDDGERLIEEFTEEVKLLEGSRGRKAVVCTSSHESALKVHRLLQSESIFALLLHDGLPMVSVRGVANEWAAPHKDTCAPVLVAQDNILSWAGIRDAAVLVHYDVPELSRFNFGFRFSCLAERMRSFDAKGDSDPRDSPLAHLILTRDNAHLSVQLAEFLTRVGAKVPPAFEQLANEELQRRACNPERPLCAHLKSFGRCLAPPTTSGTACRDRHGVVAALDRPRGWRHLPTSGEVRIFVTKMVDATYFYAWVLEHWDPAADPTAGKGGAAVVHTEFQEAMLEMNAYFAVPGGDRHIGLGENESPVVGGVYAVEVDADQFHRVQVVSVMPESGGVACSSLRAEVFHMDHGGSSKVALRRLLRLPERLARLPPFAVEVFCCRVQPQDRDLEWTFQAECTSHSLVTEKELVGKVVLCLGNTLWLDPLVKRTYLDRSG